MSKLIFSFFWHVNIQLFQLHLFKRPFFTSLNYFDSFVEKSKYHKCKDLYLNSPFCSIDDDHTVLTIVAL